MVAYSSAQVGNLGVLATPRVRRLLKNSNTTSGYISLSKQIASFQKVLQGAKDRDVNESDTVTVIADMLASVFGYDKYSEVTSELAIRGTYCDLAIKLGGEVKFLIEVKAIGLTLKENHLRQAVNYGANHGIPWVALTNGVDWEIHRIKFEKPISHEKVCEFDMLAVNARSKVDHERLFLLCKEGLSKDAIETYHKHVQVVNRFVLAALIQSDAVTSVLRRELRKLSGVKIDEHEIDDLLPGVLKRDVLEGEHAKEAQQRVKRAARKPARKKGDPLVKSKLEASSL